MLSCKSRRYVVAAAVFSLTLSVLAALSIAYVVFASGHDGVVNQVQTKLHNVYRSSYVLLERKSKDGTDRPVYCSGFIFTHRGHTFIMTASHLYWKFVGEKPYELVEHKDTLVYNARHGLIGVAYPLFINVHYDIAVLTASKEAFLSVPYKPFELNPMCFCELEEITGEDVHFLGARNIGPWFIDVHRLQPFSERTVVSRVISSRVGYIDSDDFSKMTCIFVSGNGWFGCSGGPLIYNGKVIGVCVCLESFDSKTGTVYSSVYDVCRDYLDRLPDLTKQMGDK